jgi:DNA-directed RNA polymerase specialized sigma24 family protein
VIDESERIEHVMHRFEIALLQFARASWVIGNWRAMVVQETFVKFQNNGAFSSEREPATWLFTVAGMARSTFAVRRNG